jgi:hypothetical protein
MIMWLIKMTKLENCYIFQNFAGRSISTLQIVSKFCHQMAGKLLDVSLGWELVTASLTDKK